MSRRDLFSARLLACFELEVGQFEGQPRYRLTTSIPGREGTLERAWPAVGGRLTDDALRDLAGYVAQAVTNSVLAVDGAQLQLLLR